MVEADMKFHLAISALAGHEMLLEYLADVQTQNRRLLAYSDLYQPDLEFLVHRHGHLMETLGTNDPEAIASAVHEHIYEVGLDIVDKLTLAMDHATGPMDADGQAISRATPGPALP